ncbi:MAG: hypothetical protein HN961_01645, partial [Planctomycetes bacterium]|nr:hypothetical protein [Planctomycetota bacterium]
MSLTTTLLHDFLAGDIATTELTAEASPRRYFRIESGSCPWLFVRSPQDAPIQITTWLASLGVRVPAIGASTDGAYLVEDLGDIHLAHRANLGCYQELMRTWSRFAFADLPSNIPNAKWALDTSLFQKELRQFRQEYLVRFLGVNDTFAESCDAIARQAIAGPQALQH